MSLDSAPTWPQCLNCLHISVDGKCPAFVCIPADIWDNRVDHRRAYEGDGGVRWEPSEPGFKHIRDIWQESYEREIRGRN